MTIRDHWVESGRGRLFARVWVPSGGRVETVLLIHDSLGCVETWRDFPELLARRTGRRVAAYERLGFGRSDPFPGKRPRTFISDEAREVVPRVADALGLGELIPFGHSVGGAMAIATAAALPERCRAVVTEAAQAFVEDRTIAGIEAARAGFARADQFARLVRYHGGNARPVLAHWVETWLDPAFAGWRLDDELRGLRGPLLALHGDRDEYGSEAHPEHLARLAPAGSRAVVLAGCGHVPHREQTGRVLDEVERFLASGG